MKKALMLALTLSGCATVPPAVVYRDRPVEVQVPVAQPCIVVPAGVTLTSPLPLNKQYTEQQWKALDPKQKAAILASHALELRTYGENIRGATAGCR